MISTTEHAESNFRDIIAELRPKSFRPNPDFNLVQWADNYRHLSTVSSAIGGRWRTSRFEVARGPMLATTEPGVQTISCMVATQTLKTELLLNIIGYHAHLDPCPMLLVQPKEDTARLFSKERLAPMSKATPVLKALADDRARGGKDTLFYKEFPGGFLAIAYAGSPMELASRPIRITLLDEIDKYDATKEGDPVELAEERTATFRLNKLKVRVCSPTLTNSSRIYTSWLTSDQRKPFVCCPHCDHWQTLDFYRNVHWAKTPDGEHFPMTAALYCEICGIDPVTRQPIEGRDWTETQRLRMVTTEGAIRWHQTREFTCCGVKQDPARTRNWEWSEADQCGFALCTECGERAVSNEHAGFQASKLYSPVITMAELAKKWLDSKNDPETKQVFVNTQLAEPFQLEAMRKVASNSLAARRESYLDQVPDGVLALTCGVDVQTGGEVNEGRLEIEVVGWGNGFESWSIDYKVIPGDPASPEVWAQLDKYLMTDFIDSRGYPRRIEATCIDTGGGSTETVYKYCSERVKANVWGIKGRSEISANWSPVWPPTKYNPKRTRVGYKPIMLGVSAAKEAIREFLIVETPGPGYCHFPKDRPEIYFEQLTAENLVFEYRGGKTLKKWVQPKGRANEALDTRVYAYGALRGLMVVRNLNFSIRAEMLATVGMEQIKRLVSPTAATENRAGEQTTNPRIRRSKFMA